MKKSILILTYLISFLILFSCGTRESTKENSSKTPNVVLINADDLGYGDVGCYGATLVKTPNIDRLAQEGRMFTDAHTASAVCSPSRYGLLTGRYPLRENYWGPISGLEDGLTIDTNHTTLASLLKDAGYATAAIGKWHVGFGMDKPNWNGKLKPGPLEVGFDYYFGIPVANSGPPFVYLENHNVVGYDPSDPFVEGEQAATQKWPAKSWHKKFGGAEKAHLLYEDEKVGTTFKNKAVEWIKNTHSTNKDKPFFLYLATTNIHHPFTPAPQFKGTSKCGRYGDFVHELDWIVGEVVKTLDEIGETENTLIIFTSDNGGMLNQGGQDAWNAGHKLNGDFLGFKFGAWEGGHRIPMIAKWPGKIPANSTSDHLIGQVDILTTLASLTGTSLSKEQAFDGIDQLPELVGKTKTPLREELIISPNSPAHLVVRKGKWAYIPAQDEGGFQGKEIGNHILGGAAALVLTKQKNSDVENGKIKTNAPMAQLYNLENDPKQEVNVIVQFPEVKEELHEILNNYRQKIDGPILGWINLEQTD